MTPDDEKFLRMAIELAATGRRSGNPPFGSLLVGPDGDVLAEDHNTTLTGKDITAHPELKLAKWAARELDPGVASATTMYTSCQPCRMCTSAIEQSGLGRVVFALSSEQLISLKPPREAPQVTMVGPLLFDEARVPFDGFYS